MRLRIIVVLLTLSTAEIGLPGPDLVPAPARTAEPALSLSPPLSHTRPLSPGIISLLAEATDRSSIVRSLLRQLDQTDVVVYVTDSMPRSLRGPDSYLVFLSRDTTARYLLVRINRWRLSPSQRIALLGHELQHALEVAAAPEVRDSASLADLYRRIGWEGGTDQFESEAAQTVGQSIRRQLLSGPSRVQGYESPIVDQVSLNALESDAPRGRR